MKQLWRKFWILLAAILLLSAFEGTDAEAATWTKANYTVQTTVKTYIYKKDLANTKYKAECLKKGKKIKILQISKYGWGKIKYKGKTRYIQMYKTKAVWYNVKKNMQTAKKSSVYSKTEASSGNKKATLKANTVVYAVQKSSDGWMKITYSGKTGYIRTERLKNIPVPVTKPDPGKPDDSKPEKTEYTFTVSSTVHSKITVTDAAGKAIRSGAVVKAGTKLKASISVNAGYKFHGFTGVTTSTSKSVSFKMPAKDTGICAKITRSDAGKKSYACMKDKEKLKVIYAVIRQEGGSGYEGQAAVMTTVLNRLDSPVWKGRGADPYEQVTAKAQFADMSDPDRLEECYSRVNSNTKKAVKDVLNGLRTHDCCSFRTATSTYMEKYPYGYNIAGNWFFN